MKVPELKTGQMLTLAYIAAFFIALFVVYKILGAVGLIKTRERKKADEAKAEASTQLRDADFFDPMFLKNKTGYKALGNVAAQYAHDIHQAIAGWGTNEERIYTTFGRLKSKWNISEVALNYKVQYKADMLTDILGDLNSSEQVTLWDIIKTLPEK